MAWIKPGNSNQPNNDNNNQGPHKNQGPPDIDKLIGDFLTKIRSVLPSHKSGNTNPSSRIPTSMGDHKLGLSVVFAVLIVAWFLSGLFIVNPAEQAVILRLGQYSDT